LKGVGSIEGNNRADLLLFDKNLELQTTIIAGNVAWAKSL
jgi:N-acetylglucosamine-6-phosphate deacetylase